MINNSTDLSLKFAKNDNITVTKEKYPRYITLSEEEKAPIDFLYVPKL